MSATGSGYDLNTATYSPDGRIFQVEYAAKAVDNSGTAVGIRCKDGVILGVEKLIISKMLAEGSNRRIFTIDRHAGAAVAGMLTDARMIIARARSEASNYQSFYGDHIPGDVLASRLGGYTHMHTLVWYYRPFGAAVLCGTWGKDGPQLHMIEPSGNAFRYRACAIGKGKQSAKTELEKINFEELTARQAVMEVARIIYKIHDDVKDKAFELELSWICEESNRQHQVVPADLRQAAIQAAIEAKEKEEMEE